MSMEQVRAQRAYLDAEDVKREADTNIVRLEAELQRWRRISQEAGAVGAVALPAMFDEVVVGYESPQTD